ncbi:MAG: hypothetical protein A3D10_05620 [Omnitrophica WOR_2 bacterium RIFCSPHIGHO2_02_FULL_48_11]|nr:MAG: hypothetical protein A3D10_05620 [Omnitrophica WOR_2 bacterium RIFCSPHIGHO2_02_FULL_48_11]
MNALLAPARLDAAIRGVLYILLFWIPYSSAVIETCVILGLLLFIMKRGMAPAHGTAGGRWNFFYDLCTAFKPPKTPLNKAIFLFLLLAFISASLSPYGNQSISAFFRKILEWFLIFYLVIEVFTGKKHFQVALAILLITTGAVVADSFMQVYGTGRDIFFGKEIAGGGATASFNHANGLAAYLALLIPLATAFVLKKGGGRLRKTFLCVFIIFMMWSLMMTLSRAAFLSVLVGFIFLLFFLRRKILYFFLLGIFLFCVILYFSFPADSGYRAKMKMANIQNTIDWRLGVWEDTWKMIEQKPWLGYGLNTYMKDFQHYRRKSGTMYHAPTYAHNCYLQMATEVGLFGWLAFMSIWGITGARIYANFRKQPKDEYFSVIFWGLAAGIITFLTHSLVDINFYSLQLSTIFWFIMGLFISADRSLNGSPIYDIKTS